MFSPHRFQTTITELGLFHMVRNDVYLLLFFFAIHGLIFHVLWFDFIVDESKLSKHTV